MFVYFCTAMRHRDEQKEVTLQKAALEMIVEEGFKGLSMQRLARKANLSPATIYIYYKDREDLLNQLYLLVLNRTNQAALTGFNPTMPFIEGLTCLWLNRFRYYSQHKDDFFFIEQFINSPLFDKVAGQEDKTYEQQVQYFHRHAISTHQLANLPIEVYWPIAFAPLYQLIRLHLNHGKYPQPDLLITEATVTAVIERTIKALEP